MKAFMNTIEFNTLAICAEPKPSCTKVECPKVNSNKKKEQTMYDEDDMDTDTNYNKLNYLQNRLNAIRYNRNNELEKIYGLRDDVRPMNFNEFLERITSGKYTIDEKNRTRPAYSPIDYIRWRDPSVKEDHEGYAKANKALNIASVEAMDTIVVLSDETARLSALREFEKTAATIQ